MTIGTLAVTLVPILAQLLLLNFQLRSIGSGNGSTFDLVEKMRGLSFHFLALELYVGGLCLFVGKLAVQLGCPETIARFPYEDDFVVFSASVRAAQSSLDRSRGSDDSNHPLFAVIDCATENAKAHQKAWRKENESRVFLRVVVGILFVAGALGVVGFLCARLLTNAGNTFSVFGT